MFKTNYFRSQTSHFNVIWSLTIRTDLLFRPFFVGPEGGLIITYLPRLYSLQIEWHIPRLLQVLLPFPLTHVWPLTWLPHDEAVYIPPCHTLCNHPHAGTEIKQA